MDDTDERLMQEYLTRTEKPAMAYRVSHEHMTWCYEQIQSLRRLVEKLTREQHHGV